MTVRVKDRTPNDFQVFIKARNISIHTDKIISNEKVFPCATITDATLLQNISNCAQEIYMNCWQANNIRVTNKRSYLRRNGYQQDAIDCCNKLMAYIDLARQKFHLRKNKYLYWKDCAIEVKRLVLGWKQSDNNRYKEYRK